MRGKGARGQLHGISSYGPPPINLKLWRRGKHLNSTPSPVFRCQDPRQRKRSGAEAPVNNRACEKRKRINAVIDSVSRFFLHRNTTHIKIVEIRLVKNG